MLRTALVVAATLAAAPASAQPTIPAEAGYEAVAQALERLIAHELQDKGLPAVSIALIDDQRTVWARGFGDARDGVPATAETIHRVGSVSKLFTDIAIMQRVERGAIDLDAPIESYLPDFRPTNASRRPLTLRQLMAHRSGLQREPPVGNYFDPTEPTLAATVASLHGRPLVYEPEARTKYSNAGIGVVGYVLERVAGEPFAATVARTVLAPLGMTASAFLPTPAVAARLADADMWTIDGRRFEAPTFQLGMAPAGSMYATVLDLARFTSALFAGGRGPGGQVLRRETLEAMWTPQVASAGASTGFGLGFAIGELDGRRRIGHGGAIYGFATDLAFLPDDRLGAVVVTTLDVTNAVAERITDAALRMMLAARASRALPEVRVPARLDSARVAGLTGAYRMDTRPAQASQRARPRTIELRARDGRLWLVDPVPMALGAFGDTLVVDDRLSFGRRLLPLPDGRLVDGRDTLARFEPPLPAAAPDRWRGLIGEYGWDHNTLYILEQDGVLHALIEWFFLYPLEELAADTFAFPQSGGLYPGERLIFTRDVAGRATRVEAASVVFERRAVGTEAGVTFRITPVRPVEELRAAALAATPPVETGDFRASDLVELRSLDPTIRYDIRYATTNNFMGAVFYGEPLAFLQRPAAEALVRAHRALASEGYGLLIHDAYRPWYVTKMFWDATPQDMKDFVANPANGSRHNRGAAVDLTLYRLDTGEPVEMVGGYDEFSDRSYPDYPGGTSRQRWHRQLLRAAMEAEGFTVYDVEWWHFDYRDWRRYRIGNETFGRIR
jgi:CubicO group peptidase (beta-lactamase class C family)/D-alanyl-D-alanine dipeptidase